MHRILTPPKELAPLLKGAFPAFEKLLGHIRFCYIADGIWDGKSSLIFAVDGVNLITVALEAGKFNVHIADGNFEVDSDALPNSIFDALKKTIHTRYHRPLDQRTGKPGPNGYICGNRCDLCLGYQCHNEIPVMGSDNFSYMDWACYSNCIPERIERPATHEKGHGIFRCSGCNTDRNKFCRGYTCSKEKGYNHCAECGEHHSCDAYRDSHHAAQCNLGITAEEVTKLVVPYCMKERFDTMRENFV